jgi:hypothetical protein
VLSESPLLDGSLLLGAKLSSRIVQAVNVSVSRNAAAIGRMETSCSPIPTWQMVRGSRRFSYCGITTARADASRPMEFPDLFGSGVENSSIVADAA